MSSSRLDRGSKHSWLVPYYGLLVQIYDGVTPHSIVITTAILQ